MSLKSIVIVVLGVFACSSAFALTPAEKQMQKYCNSMTGVQKQKCENTLEQMKQADKLTSMK